MLVPTAAELNILTVLTSMIFSDLSMLSLKRNCVFSFSHGKEIK